MRLITLKWADLGQLFDGPHATPPRVAAGPYFLNIASLRDGRLDLSLSDHVTPPDFAKWTRRVTPQAGDLLFSYETRLGEAALMPAGIDACLGRRMALLRPDPEVVDSQYLLYYYLSPAFQRTIAERTVHGATVPRILLSDMPSWPVRIADLDAQRAIAEVLGAFDDKIAANAKLVETADQLASALVQQHASSPVVPLNEVAVVTMGSSPPGSSYNESGDGIAFFQGIRDFGVRYPSQRVWTTAPVRLAQQDDTLLSVRAPVGRANRSRGETCIGRGLASVRSLTGQPMTLFHLLRDSDHAWAPYEAEGTVFGSINKTQLNNVEIKSVAPERAATLEQALVSLEHRITSALSESEVLATTRDTLLPGLMLGTITIKDAERTAEEVL